MTPIKRSLATRAVPERRLTPSWKPPLGEGPVIFRGAGLKLFPGWSIPWLVERCGREQVPVRSSRGTTSMSLARAAGIIERCDRSGRAGFRGGAPYVWDWDFNDARALRGRYSLPPFARDDAVLDIPASRRPRLLWIFFGGSRSGTSLHQDVIGAHAWSAVIAGRKEWMFYPPETRFEDPDAHDAFSGAGRAADRAAGREPWLGVVGPGDLIFAPSLWWHHVRNIGPTLAVSGNFVTPVIAPVVYEACEKLGYRHITHQLEQSYSYRPTSVSAATDAGSSRRPA